MNETRERILAALMDSLEGLMMTVDDVEETVVSGDDVATLRRLCVIRDALATNMRRVEALHTTTD